jgi:hypothetical protein
MIASFTPNKLEAPARQIPKMIKPNDKRSKSRTIPSLFSNLSILSVNFSDEFSQRIFLAEKLV